MAIINISTQRFVNYIICHKFEMTIFDRFNINDDEYLKILFVLMTIECLCLQKDQKIYLFHKTNDGILDIMSMLWICKYTPKNEIKGVFVNIELKTTFQFVETNLENEEICKLYKDHRILYST